MATPKDYVDKQWDEWSEKNPVGSFEHIDTELLKETLIRDLTYASQMDVREYTLYQKWQEVHEKYPTREVFTLFGDNEVQLLDDKHKKEIDDIKSKIWNPSNPDDYQNLKPKLILSNGPLADKWNTLRTFSSTMKPPNKSRSLSSLGRKWVTN